MRFNKLDLNLLVALDVLLTLRSVSRAAEQLHMSQSAMSNALARLRDYFGDELLVQVGRKMELTPRAEVLQEAVHDVLLRVDTTIAALPQFSPAQSEREFRIFASDYTCVTLMPHLLAQAGRQAPLVRFQLLPQDSRPQRALERGEADLLVMPKSYCSTEHPTQTLFEESFCCVVWNASQHAHRAMSREAYTAAGHVVMRPPGGTQPSFETGFMQEHGLARRVDVEAFSFVAAAALVAGTERIATVHERLARQLRGGLPITLRPLPVPMPPMEQAMQWHKYRTQDPGLAWLRELMQEAVLCMDGVNSTDSQVPFPPRSSVE